MSFTNANQIIGEPFIELSETDSTNNYAMQSIKKGSAHHGACFFAYNQTSGKGQRLKEWISKPGYNILLSVVLNTLPLKVNQLFEISVITAIAAHDLFSFYALSGTFIKWPNDIYFGDKKAGGILIENLIKGNIWQFATCGMGLNINQTDFPESLKAISLKQITGRTFDVIHLAKQFCNNLQKRYNQLLNNDFEELLKYYNSLLYKKNELVKLKKENIAFNCTIKEVNKYGQLITEGSENNMFNFGEVEWIMD